MFEPEDFTIPLEKELRLHKINKEIDECTDVDILKLHLKNTVEQLTKYQHLLAITLQKQLEQELSKAFK